MTTMLPRDRRRPSAERIVTFMWSKTSPGAGWALLASIARPGVSNCLWRKES